jgi:hypothetical protein
MAEHDEEPTRDLGKIFDLNRTKLTKGMVSEMENAYRQIQSAQDDLKAIVASAKEQEFTARDCWAMKKLAKLRLDDKKGAAREELEALDRIGKAIDFDLFDWASLRS